jgi:hypothetical protein
MTRFRRTTFLASSIILGVICYAVWFFVVGPNMMVREIQHHSLSAVERICRSGISPDRDAWLVGGLFHCAVASGDTNIVLMMVDRGADLNRLDGYGMTPLHVATKQGDLGMMRLLLSHGADSSRRNRQGATALDFAAQAGLDAPRRYLQQIAEKPN